MMKPRGRAVGRRSVKLGSARRPPREASRQRSNLRPSLRDRLKPSIRSVKVAKLNRKRRLKASKTKSVARRGKRNKDRMVVVKKSVREVAPIRPSRAFDSAPYDNTYRNNFSPRRGPERERPDAFLLDYTHETNDKYRRVYRDEMLIKKESRLERRKERYQDDMSYARRNVRDRISPDRKVPVSMDRFEKRFRDSDTHRKADHHDTYKFHDSLVNNSRPEKYDRRSPQENHSSSRKLERSLSRRRDDFISKIPPLMSKIPPLMSKLRVVDRLSPPLPEKHYRRSMSPARRLGNDYDHRRLPSYGDKYPSPKRYERQDSYAGRRDPPPPSEERSRNDISPKRKKYLDSGRIFPPDQRNHTSPSRRLNNSSPPPRRANNLSTPRRGNVSSPARRANNPSPSRRGNMSPAVRRGVISSPARRRNLSSSPRRGNMSPAVRRGVISSPARRRNSSSSPRRSPARRANNLSPPRRSPARRANNLSPPRRSPARRANNLSPPRRSPARRANNLSPPRRSPVRRANNLSPPRRSPVRRANNLSPPRRSPARRAKNSSPPRRSPARRVNNSSPPRRGNMSPPRRSVISSPPRRGNVSSPARRSVIGSPARRGIPSSARRSVISPPPWRANVSSPSRRSVIGSPVRRGKISSPVRRVFVSSPGRRGNELSPQRRSTIPSPARRGLSPQRRSNHASPPRRLISSPARRGNDLSPRRGNNLAPVQRTNNSSPLRRRNSQSTIRRIRYESPPPPPPPPPPPMSPPPPPPPPRDLIRFKRPRNVSPVHSDRSRQRPASPPRRIVRLGDRLSAPRSEKKPTQDARKAPLLDKRDKHLSELALGNKLDVTRGKKRLPLPERLLPEQYARSRHATASVNVSASVAKSHRHISTFSPPPPPPPPKRKHIDDEKSPRKRARSPVRSKKSPYPAHNDTRSPPPLRKSAPKSRKDERRWRQSNSD